MVHFSSLATLYNCSRRPEKVWTNASGWWFGGWTNTAVEYGCLQQV